MNIDRADHTDSVYAAWKIFKEAKDNPKLTQEQREFSEHICMQFKRYLWEPDTKNEKKDDVD